MKLTKKKIKSMYSENVNQENTLAVPHAAERDIGRRAIGRILGPRRHPVAIAIAGVAQVAAALHHPLRPRRRTHRIQPRGRLMPGGMEPVRAPLPGIAGRAQKPVAIGQERVDGPGRSEAVLA